MGGRTALRTPRAGAQLQGDGYDHGALYDYRRDPLEKNLLVPASLTPAQEESRRKLQRALDTLK